MKTWFTSLNGALALTALAWLSELWRTAIDAAQQFYMPASRDVTGLYALVYTVFLAWWAYALHTATRGSRGGLMTAFALNALFWLGIPIGTVFFYCTGPCAASAGIVFNTVNWLNLILGLLAGVALALVLWRKGAQAMAA
ncbi:MAG: hypothetical protein AAB217_08370 [Chloroflexota bacterium]